LDPVDSTHLPDYDSVVKQPASFFTILEKLQSGVFQKRLFVWGSPKNRSNDGIIDKAPKIGNRVALRECDNHTDSKFELVSHLEVMTETCVDWQVAVLFNLRVSNGGYKFMCAYRLFVQNLNSSEAMRWSIILQTWNLGLFIAKPRS
jgi:hypothetical protein